MRYANFLLGASVLTLCSLGVQAQQIPQDPNISGEVQTPASWNLLKFLANRIHTLNIGTRVDEMRLAGVTSREYFATFGVSGAMVYSHEIMASKVGLDKVGKNAGMQFLPFSVSLADDGRVFVSVGAFSVKNMISARGVSAGPGGYYGESTYPADSAWAVIDNIDVLIYEYDQNYLRANTVTHGLKLFSIDNKVDILNSSKPGEFLAITFGVDSKFSWEKIQTSSPDAPINTRSDMANINYRYGLEYNRNLGKNWRINAKVTANNEYMSMRSNNPFMSGYEQLQKDYVAAKTEYEANSNGGVTLSDEEYSQLTGNSVPVKPADVLTSERTYTIISPVLSISKGFAKTGKNATRIGLNIYSNLVIKDNTRGGINIDSKDAKREVLGAKLFYNF